MNYLGNILGNVHRKYTLKEKNFTKHKCLEYLLNYLCAIQTILRRFLTDVVLEFGSILDLMLMHPFH